MKQQRLALLVIAGLFLSASVNAQMGIKFRGSGSWCVGDRYDQAFISSNQETIVGQIMSIDTVTPFRDMGSGIKIVLKTDREDNIAVHLGPAWFILYQDMSLSVNDKNIEVRGCRTMIDGKPVIMASTLVRRDRILLLRDKDGYPYWCAWRKKMD